MSRILIVEDEAAMAEGLKDNLELEGYTVDLAADGGKGLQFLKDNTYDLAILDVMLPSLSGFDILKSARQSGILTPAIMLTARGEEIDRVLGLELGADDYLTKPFSLRELLARVKAILRRSDQPAAESVDKGMIRAGTIEINRDNYTVRVGGKEIFFPKKEFEVLQLLASHPGKVFNREKLLQQIWGSDVVVVDRTVDVHVRRIREKLGNDAGLIETIKGVGYRFKEE